MVARRHARSSSTHQKTPIIDDWPSRRRVDRRGSPTARVTPLAATGAPPRPSRSSRPTASSIAFTISDDPPTWARRATRAGRAGRRAARRACWPRRRTRSPTSSAGRGDGRRSWSPRPHGMRRPRRARCPSTAAPRRCARAGTLIGRRAGAESRRARTSGSRRRTSDRAPEPFVAPLARDGAAKVATVQPSFGAPFGRSETSDAGSRRTARDDRRPADLSGRLRGRHAGAAAAGHPRRPGRRLRAQLHRRRRPLSGRGLRRARLRRAARRTRAAAAATARSSGTPTTATGAAATTAT